MPWVGLSSVIVNFPGYTHLLINKIESVISTFVDYDPFFKGFCYKQIKNAQIRL